LRFESDIWPSSSGLSIKIATDASDIGWGGHTLSGVTYVAHEYFSAWEAIQSFTYREFLGVNRCLQALLNRCKGKFVVLQVDAMNLLGIVTRGSPKLPLNVLARELFWLCLIHKITISVEWVPREANACADDISKMLISDDWSIFTSYFNWLDVRWGPHSIDSFFLLKTTFLKGFTLFIGVDKLLVSTPLVLIGAKTIVGSMLFSA
jgi:hypothetical protein